MVKVFLASGEKVLMDKSTWLNLPWPRYFSIQPSGHVLVSCVLHRLATQPLPGMHVDHKNGNPLDNRLENLRICTNAQNMRNKKKARKEGNTAKFKGVDKAPRQDGYRARITINGKTKYLGSYKTQEQAAAAYNEAAKIHHGEYAYLNKIEE